jgi:hypothetical protein
MIYIRSIARPDTVDKRAFILIILISCISTSKPWIYDICSINIIDELIKKSQTIIIDEFALNITNIFYFI